MPAPVHVQSSVVRHAPPARQRGQFPWLAALIGAAVLLLVLGVAGLAWYKRHERQAEQARFALELEQAERARAERPRQACQLTRERIQRGSVVSPLDAEGWVVELTLWRETKPTQTAPPTSLAPFVEHERVVWREVPELTAGPAANGRVRLEAQDVVDASGAPWQRVQLVFEGGYVPAYFDEPRRRAFARLAQALARELESTYAGLYGRCATGATHHLGAWFEGPSAAHAVAALTYFMGRFAEVPHLVPERLRRGDEELAAPTLLGELRQASSALTRPRLGELLHDLGVVGPGADKARVAITFPLNDANRATRASLRVAEQLGWAPRH